MDRFIVEINLKMKCLNLRLKSNMDRFIAEKYNKAAVMYIV